MQLCKVIMNRQILDGKVIVVIGASSGLGLAFVEEFCAEGAKVTMVGRTQSTINETAEAVRAKGGEVLPSSEI